MNKINEDIKGFFEVHTKIYKEHARKNRIYDSKDLRKIKNIDELFCFSPSISNFILTIDTILFMFKDFNVKTLPADDPGLFHVGQVIWYEDKNEKEHAMMLRIPLTFCDDKGMKKLEKWRNKNNKK